jgi:hypothetical protein
MASTDLHDHPGLRPPASIKMPVGLRHRLSPFQRSQFRHIERLSASCEEHAAIIEASMAHDVGLLLRACHPDQPARHRYDAIHAMTVGLK